MRTRMTSMDLKMINPSTVVFFNCVLIIGLIFSFASFKFLFNLALLLNHRIHDDKKESVAPQNEKKYIVFHSMLMNLFAVCPVCTEPASAEICKVIGTLIHVTQKCTNCSYSRVWRSQPNIRRIPAGNLLLSAAILYSGSMISQSLRMLKILKVECFSRQTFHKHQKNYLIPVVIKMWRAEQERVIQSMSSLEGGVVLSGDGRSDSPGHCAKYGAFTVIEQRVNKVLDVQLVQVSTDHNVTDIYHRFTMYIALNFISFLSQTRCKTVPGANTRGFYVRNDSLPARISS